MDRRSFLKHAGVAGGGLALASERARSAAAPAEIRVGIITEAKGPHLSIYLSAFGATPGIAGVAVADASSATFAEARARLGGRGASLQTYTDYVRMLREFRPELVLVSLAADHAPEPIVAALEAGCNVIAEKPACVRAADFERAVRAAETKQRYLMLAFANRRLPPAMKARELIQSGMLGKLYGVDMYTIADQTRLKNPEYQRAWYASKSRAGGGHLMWLGIHYLDLIQYISGDRIRQVTGFARNVGGTPIDVEDAAVVALQFAGGKRRHAPLRLLPRPRVSHADHGVGLRRLAAVRPHGRHAARVVLDPRRSAQRGADRSLSARSHLGLPRPGRERGGGGAGRRGARGDGS